MKLTIVPLVISLSACLFYACSADEVDELQPTDKAQLLLAKSREFARKYGVDVKLNEENIEEIARTKTVEELEDDFQMFAVLKDEIFTAAGSVPRTRRGMRLRVNTNLQEENGNPQDKTGSYVLHQSIGGTYKFRRTELIGGRLVNML